MGFICQLQGGIALDVNWSDRGFIVSSLCYMFTSKSQRSNCLAEMHKLITTVDQCQWDDAAEERLHDIPAMVRDAFLIFRVSKSVLRILPHIYVYETVQSFRTDQSIEF